MKRFIIAGLAALTVTFILVSCRKDSSSNIPEPTVDRKFSFQLYTNQDFSNDNSVIHFSIFIRTANKTLFDSAFASMQIKDIPDALHKLVIEKTVAANANLDLAAGFNYEIENVGNSWHVDTSSAGNLFKVIDYNFQ